MNNNEINYTQLLQGISEKRLMPYNTTFAIPPKKPNLTMFCYTAHQDIATKLCYVLHLIEINLRNNLDNNLKIFVGKDDWIESFTLSRISLKQFEEAKDNVKRDFNKKNKQPTYDDYLSQLTFGFWIYLLASRFKRDSNLNINNFWTIYIDRVFPGRNGKNLNEIIQLLKQVKKTRDRFSHHEPLWKPSASKYKKSNARENFIHSIDYMINLYDRESKCLKVCQPEAFNYINHIKHREKFIDCCENYKKDWEELAK